MSGEQYERLREDIRANGLLNAIVVHEEMILDGRHRWKACTEIGIAPRTTPFTGKDPLAYVFSANVAHRHLTKTQLGMAAAKLKGYYAEQAKARMAEGGKNKGVGNPAPLDDGGKARDAAGKALGVCGTTVDDGEFILKNGTPELIAKVEAGAISIYQGRQIAAMPKRQQREVVEIPKKELAKFMRRSRSASSGKKAAAARKLDPPADVTTPGTPLVKALLARLETIASEMERSGMTVDQYAETFVREFDWHEPILLRRLAYAETAISCIGKLGVIGQRAKRAAA